jgi:hypothetical protein
MWAGHCQAWPVPKHPKTPVTKLLDQVILQAVLMRTGPRTSTITCSPIDAGYISFMADTSAGLMAPFSTTDREACARSPAGFLAADSAGATESAYIISRDDSANPNATVHANLTIHDASGIGARTWSFAISASAGSEWQIGKLSQFAQLAAQGGTVLQRDTYGWSRDPEGNPYISAKLTVLNENLGFAILGHDHLHLRISRGR